MNLPRRVWYPRTGHWEPGKPQAFTTVLLPHAPDEDPARLAATITLDADAPTMTALRITEGDTVRLVMLSNGEQVVTVEDVSTDAEAMMLTYRQGKPMHVSAWNLRMLRTGTSAILCSDARRNLDRDLNQGV